MELVSPESPKMYDVEKIGGVDCTIVDDLQGNERPKLAVVMAHGFGASGSDLVSIGTSMLRDYPHIGETTRFYFPAAPIDLTKAGIPGGRAWWTLDVDALMRANQSRNYDALRIEEPKGLPAAREAIDGVINYIQGHDGIPVPRMVVGGFSQGAMLATDFALRSSEAPAELVVFSGTLTNEKNWREFAAKRGKLKVLQSHGYQDPVLPFVAATWLKEMFEEFKFDLDFMPYQGFHGIPQSALTTLAEHLKKLVGWNE